MFFKPLGVWRTFVLGIDISLLLEQNGNVALVLAALANTLIL